MHASTPECRLVALVGLRASGKTTLGRLLAERLGWTFVDGDDRLAAAVGKPVGAFLREAGEPAFRAAEAAVLQPILTAGRRLVLATGGGAVLSPEVRAELGRADVLTLWLCADAAVLARRSAAAGIDRPPLTDADPVREFALLAERRRDLYAEVAGAPIDTGSHTVAASLDRLLALVAARGIVAAS